jgi:PKD repeat protein
MAHPSEECIGMSPGRAARAIPRAAVVLIAFVLVVTGTATVLAIGPPPGRSASVSAAPGSVGYNSRASPASDASAPSAAPTLGSTGRSPAAIALSWSDGAPGGSTVNNYTVESGSAATGWRLVTAVVISAAATLSTTVSGLSPSENHTWLVDENYETCLILCSFGSVDTNLLNLSQPSVAFLNATSVTSSSATLHWTNNASYGGGLAFDQYSVYEEKNGADPALVETFTSAGTLSYAASLAAGASYSFFVVTSDCTAGCGGGSPTLSTTQSNILTLGTPETLSVLVVADRTPIDLGQSDLFTCTAIGGESPFSYAWDFGSGTLVPGAANEGAILTATGTVSVTCQVTDAEPVEATGGAGVVVDPPLIVVASLNRTSADVGQAVGYTCAPVNGSLPYSITWNFGDSTESSVGSGTHTFLTAGSYAPSCTVSDGAGATLAPAFPLVISPPVAVVASVSSPAAAPDTSLHFGASPSNGSGTYASYEWTFAPGVTTAGASATYAFLAPGRYTVAVTVRDSNNGSATGSVSVTVTNIAITLANPPTSAVKGVSSTFAATASGGAGGPYNYTWHFGDGAVGYGASIGHVYSSTGKFTPTLTVSDRLGASRSTTLDAVSVAVAPAALDWLTGWVVLAIAAAIAAVLALFVFVRRRRAESAALAAAPSSAYVPPTDPKRTIRGKKICGNCGASNLPVRTTCAHCGKPLPRAPSD